MPKTEKPVDKQILIASITEAEKDGAFPNQNLLWKKVADIYNSKVKPELHISFSVVMLRVRAWNIAVKTQPGRRGSHVMTPEHKAALAASRVGVKRDRGRKLRANPRFNDCIKAMQDVLEGNGANRYLPLVDKVARGSMKATIRLQCLMCTGFQPREIARCTGIDCPLWLLRPFKNAQNLPEDPIPSEIRRPAKPTKNDEAELDEFLDEYLSKE